MAADLRPACDRSGWRIATARGAALLAAAWCLSVAASPSPPTAAPTSSPTPRLGQVSLTPVAGAGGTAVVVSGSGFPPGQPVILYWDSPSRILKTGAADPQGAFQISIIVPADPVGAHLVCAQGAIASCATFTLQAAPTPTPSPTPSPTASPSATPSPTPSPSATPSPSPTTTPAPAVRPSGSGDSALSILFRPPFIILPALILLVAVVIAVYLIWLGRRKPPPPRLVTLDRRTQTPARPQPPPPQPITPAPPWTPDAAGAPPLTPEPPAPKPASTPGSPPLPARPPHPPRAPGYPTDEPPDLPEAGD